MDYQDLLSSEGKLRIIQEIVPGKQITLALLKSCYRRYYYDTCRDRYHCGRPCN